MRVAREVHARAEEVLSALNERRSWWPSWNPRRRKPWQVPYVAFLFRRQRRLLQKQSNERLHDWLVGFERMLLVVYGALLAELESGEAKKPDEQSVDAKVEELAKDEERPDRLSYNLACYYSIRGGNEKRKGMDATPCYEEALRHLERSLEDGGYFVDAADEDVSLRGVRCDPVMGERFAKLIEKYRIREEVRRSGGLPLARLSPIGKVHAKRLESLGVVHGADLIEKAGAPEARQELAAGLGVCSVLLDRWALLADLMRVPGIDAGEASLLDWARAGSLEALRDSDTEDLTDLLNHLNQARQLAAQHPTEDKVRGWIGEATKLQPQVRIH